MRKKCNYWTIEKCTEEAMKYHTKIEFRNGSKSCYDTSYKRGWLNDICLHMFINRNSWTKDDCHNAATLYNTRNEFQKKSRNEYNAAFKNKWLNDICSHMNEVVKHKNYWNKEKCTNEAIKYSTKKEFRTRSYSAYQISLRMKWLDEICSHMIRIGDIYNRCIYVYEFSDKHAYVGLTHNFKNRDITRRYNADDPVVKHIKITNTEPKYIKLTDYVLVEVAAILENEYISQYKNNGWNLLNIAKGGSIGGTIRYWTKERCMADALKYLTKKDFREESKSGYSATKRYGWLVELCSHMN